MADGIFLWKVFSWHNQKSFVCLLHEQREMPFAQFRSPKSLLLEEADEEAMRDVISVPNLISS